MPQVAGPAIKERAKRLRAAGEMALRKRLASEVGAVREVLIEKGRVERPDLPIGGVIEGQALRAVKDCDRGGELVEHAAIGADVTFDLAAQLLDFREIERERVFNKTEPADTAASSR